MLARCRQSKISSPPPTLTPIPQPVESLPKSQEVPVTESQEGLELEEASNTYTSQDGRHDHSARGFGAISRQQWISIRDAVHVGPALSAGGGSQ